MNHMPDLPVADQVVEQRRVIKFWIERCKSLEEENEKLKSDLDKITGALGNMNKGKFMKNSNLNSLYDE